MSIESKPERGFPRRQPAPQARAHRNPISKAAPSLETSLHCCLAAATICLAPAAQKGSTGTNLLSSINTSRPASLSRWDTVQDTVQRSRTGTAPCGAVQLPHALSPFLGQSGREL